MPNTVSVTVFLLVCGGTTACAAAEIEAPWVQQRPPETYPSLEELKICPSGEKSDSIGSEVCSPLGMM